ALVRLAPVRHGPGRAGVMGARVPGPGQRDPDPGEHDAGSQHEHGDDATPAPLPAAAQRTTGAARAGGHVDRGGAHLRGGLNRAPRTPTPSKTITKIETALSSVNPRVAVTLIVKNAKPRMNSRDTSSTSRRVKRGRLPVAKGAHAGTLLRHVLIGVVAGAHE